MKYMMFVATDTEPEPDAQNALPIEEWVAKYDASGVHVSGSRLRSPDDATTVRYRAGKVLVTDGPYAEAREWIAGFDILECDDLDHAVAVAAEHPMAHLGRIELRPFWPFDGDE